MRYRFLLLAGWMLVTSAYALHPDRKLERPIDEVIVNELTEPIQASDLEVLVLMQPGQCSAPPNGQKASDALLIRLFACKAFVMASDDADATLPLHAHQLRSRLPSAKATLAAGKAALSGKRYVAMIAWDVYFRGPPRACEPCIFPVEVPMEIAVMDTRTGRRVWQSHHISQMAYRGRAFDPQAARQLGLSVIERLVKVVLSQRQVLAAEAAGWRRVDGFMMMGTEMKSPPPNPGARLIIANNEQVHNGWPHESRYTVLLSALPPSQELRTLYTIPAHNFVALDLPPGKYALTASKDETYEFEIGEAPVYLAVRKPMLAQPRIVNPLSTEELLDLSEDLVNALIPEKMPASYRIKDNFIFWPQP